MINEKEYALIRDLAALLRKHGPEAFEAVARLLSSPEFIDMLTEILMTTATVGRASISSRRPLALELEKLKEVEPEKYGIINSFIEAFKARRILPSLKDVKVFVAENNLPEIKAESRSKALSQLTRSLLRLSSEQLQKMLAELIKQGRSDSSLSEWSEIITKGMARSTKYSRSRQENGLSHV